VQALKKLGLNIYYKDVTTSDIESYGFKVARTIIPGMQPLDNDHRYRFLGGQRRKNIKNKYAKSSKLNNDPHPFP
jgi:ribosomal protein S12 methylthiotransferase accessory factor